MLRLRKMTFSVARRVDPAASNLQSLRAARLFVLPGLTLALFFGVAVGLQTLAGAYRVELSGYPDETGHFASGALVGSYLKTFPPQPLLRFAKEFYIHRPKVAIGHWPPVLYLIEGVWFVLFHSSRRSALALMALICASVAASIAHVVGRRYGSPAGIGAGLFFICLGFVQIQTSQVMSDMLVALFGFWATLSFADFLTGNRTSDLVRFAAFALLAIFTKNSGLYLGLTPPICILLTREFAVLRKPGLWLAAVAVAAPAIAWVVWTRSLLPARMFHGPALQVFAQATQQDFNFLYYILGPWLLILIAAGVVHNLIGFRAGGDYLPLALLSAALSVFLFESIAAIQGVAAAAIEGRFLLPLVAALIPILFSGLLWLAASARLRAIPITVRAAALLLVAILISPRTFAIPVKPYRGFAEVADLIESDPSLRMGATLVSSVSDGEGLLISEILMRYPSSEGFILRASNTLAEEDWLGRDYKLRFKSAEEVFAYLKEMQVNLVVIEDQPGNPAPAHQGLLLQMCREHPDYWRSAGIFPTRRPPDLKGSQIFVYQGIGASAPADHKIRREMEQILRRRIGK